jgi:sirohydrochlorin cobaltochelatase
MSQRAGIVLFAHGSRDPQWAAPLYAIEAQIKRGHPEQTVGVAFLEIGQPDLIAAIASMAATGVTRIAVLPVFLGVGKHLREDLPLLVQQAQSDFAHASLRLRLLPALGEHPLFAAWVASLALDAVEAFASGVEPA